MKFSSLVPFKDWFQGPNEKDANKLQESVSKTKIIETGKDGGKHADLANVSLDDVILARGISAGVKCRYRGNGKRKRTEDLSLSAVIRMQRENGEDSDVSKSLHEIILTKKRKQSSSSSSTSSDSSPTSEKNGSGHLQPSRIIPWPKNLRQMEKVQPMKALKCGEAVAVDEIETARTKEVSYTPESCLRMLSEVGFFFDIEVWELKNVDLEQYGKRRWRVAVYDGNDETGLCKGVGEAPRKQLAKDSAIMDLMDKLKLHRQDLLVPNCQIAKGSRISPYVLLALDHFCAANGLKPPIFSEDLVTVKDREKIKFTVSVNNKPYSYSSTNFKYAKLGAARKAFEDLCGRKFHLDEVIAGDDCLDEKEFKLVETEQLHIVFSHLASLPPPAANFSEMVFSSSDPSVGAAMCNPGCSKRLKIATVSEPIIASQLAEIRQRINAQTAHQAELNQLIAEAHSEAAGNYTKIFPTFKV